MQTITVSATKARQDFFNIFNKVFAGTEVLVKKDGKQTIRMVPMVSDLEDWEIRKRKILKTLNETRGALKGVKFRSPLRGKNSNKWLGTWDL